MEPRGIAILAALVGIPLVATAAGAVFSIPWLMGLGLMAAAGALIFVFWLLATMYNGR